jgi:8-oxo-dGTP pyrophosphatase MutT (NUDIX family)
MSLDSKLPKKIVFGVMALPIRHDKHFLLSQRNQPGTEAWHNKWQVAGGGLEFGETPEQALAREIQEELQVSIRILYPNPIVKTSIWYGSEVDTKMDAQIILTTYIVDIGDQEPNVAGDEETKTFGWYSLEEAMELDSLPMTREIVKEGYQMCNKYSLWGMLQ